MADCANSKAWLSYMSVTSIAADIYNIAYLYSWINDFKVNMVIQGLLSSCPLAGSSLLNNNSMVRYAWLKLHNIIIWFMVYRRCSGQRANQKHDIHFVGGDGRKWCCLQSCCRFTAIGCSQVVWWKMSFLFCPWRKKHLSICFWDFFPLKEFLFFWSIVNLSLQLGVFGGWFDALG